MRFKHRIRSPRRATSRHDHAGTDRNAPHVADVRVLHVSHSARALIFISRCTHLQNRTKTWENVA
jgi:hypothetical protein